MNVVGLSKMHFRVYAQQVQIRIQSSTELQIRLGHYYFSFMLDACCKYVYKTGTEEEIQIDVTTIHLVMIPPL